VELATAQIRASASPAKYAIEQDEKPGCRDRMEPRLFPLPQANSASRIFFDLDLLQDVALSRAHARQVGCGSTYRDASVGNGVMKLLQYEANG
jgi:hypothetical protein